MVVIEVLPLPEFLIKELGIVYDNPLEHPIKLFLVDPVASFDLPVQSWPSWLYIYMTYALVQHMPVELALKL